MIDHPDARVALAAARAGAAALAPFLARPAPAERKDDGSPVTEADRAASRAALEALEAGAPGDARISEEAPPPEGWAGARRRWFVDPLDGTREYVAGIPEFVVMVGLVEDGRPAVGCVLDPTTGRAWLGVVGAGAWAVEPDGARRPLRAPRRAALAGAREAISRFHEPPDLPAWAAAAGVVDRRPCGSMGLKAARIAEGQVDFHLRPRGRCAYWDSAGPVALLLAAGGEAGDGRGRPLRYDDPSLAHEGLLICAGGLLAPIAASFAGWAASTEGGA
ncbi:MAG: 3'(2'),5'-bisphosphate nucleotidase CysQ [Planctomycetes bacterium]|nr:3'(2'),5'-bisphosphate nucleotidase CysQ [Planctomycetota bacterium]